MSEPYITIGPDCDGIEIVGKDSSLSMTIKEAERLAAKLSDAAKNARSRMSAFDFWWDGLDYVNVSPDYKVVGRCGCTGKLFSIDKFTAQIIWKRAVESAME